MARPYRTQRQKYLSRWAELKTERSTWDDKHKDIAQYCAPHRYRETRADVNRDKTVTMLNDAAGMAIRTLASAMTAGIVSAARPWLRLSLISERYMTSPKVRYWLQDVTDILLRAFSRTNFYQIADVVFRDLAAFGTHVSYVMDDPDSVIRFCPLLAGSYAVASGANGKIDTLYHELTISVSQLVEEFGYDNCSTQVQRFWDDNKYDVRVNLLHAVEPNYEVDSTYADYRGKRWKSVWLELDRENDRNTEFLRTAGHDVFPVLSPRWTVSGEDVYGIGPANDALPIIHKVEKLEYSHAETLQLIRHPVWSVPDAMKEQGGVDNVTPGTSIYRPTVPVAGGDRIEPIHNLNALQAILGMVSKDIQDCEAKIRSAFYVDFWLAILGNERVQPSTAEEVRAKKEERMLQLGPVLESVQSEYLAPTVKLMLGALMDAGEIPLPPKELIDALESAGQYEVQFAVEYSSIASVAQKALGLTTIRSFLEFVASVAGLDPQALDIISTDNLVEIAAKAFGVDPHILKDMEVVQQLRAARARQQQAAEQGQQMLAATEGARNLGATPAPSSENLLGPVLGALGPVAAQLLPGGGT